MLQQEDAALLEDALRKLVGMIDGHAHVNVVVKQASEIIGSIADDGTTDAQRHKVLRGNWRQNWLDLGAVTTGWFWAAGSGILDQRSGQALHAATTALVRLVMNGTTVRLQRRYGVMARDACAEYLELREQPVNSESGAE